MRMCVCVRLRAPECAYACTCVRARTCLPARLRLRAHVRVRLCFRECEGAHSRARACAGTGRGLRAHVQGTGRASSGARGAGYGGQGGGRARARVCVHKKRDKWKHKWVKASHIMNAILCMSRKLQQLSCLGINAHTRKAYASFPMCHWPHGTPASHAAWHGPWIAMATQPPSRT